MKEVHAISTQRKYLLYRILGRPTPTVQCIRLQLVRVSDYNRLVCPIPVGWCVRLQSVSVSDSHILLPSSNVLVSGCNRLVCPTVTCYCNRPPSGYGIRPQSDSVSDSKRLVCPTPMCQCPTPIWWCVRSPELLTGPRDTALEEDGKANFICEPAWA